MASSARLGVWTRGAMAAGAAGLVAVLVTASRLDPDPSGHGTHTQLGLPPCAFRARTGRPCPSCGMTTAFAWAVRGRLDRAIVANPAGGLLAPSCVALIPWMLAAALRGRTWGSRSPDGPLIVLVVATGSIALLAWIVRVL